MPLNSIFQAPPDIKHSTLHKWAPQLQETKERFHQVHQYARDHLSEAVKRQRQQYHHERKDFYAGSKVWLFMPKSQLGASKKLSSYWTGPWIVCAKPTSSETLIQISPDPQWAQGHHLDTKAVSIDHLKRYRSKLTILASNEASP